MNKKGNKVMSIKISKTKIDYSQVDWSMNDAMIARQYKLTQPSVRAMREKLGKPDSPVKYQREGGKIYNWKDVDWEQKDSDIARLLTCSRERVRQVRAKLQLPESPNKHLSGKSIQVRDWMLAHKEQIAGMPLSYIMAMIPFATYGIVRSVGKKLGMRFAHANQRYPWHLMNWDLPNSDLETIWRVVFPHEVANYRTKHKLRPPRWHLYTQPSDPDYPKTIAEEQQKAKHFIKRLEGLGVKYPLHGRRREGRES